MRLVKLTSEITVNPEFVTEIEANFRYGSLTVKMADGAKHHVAADYGKSVTETCDRIVKELEAAS